MHQMTLDRKDFIPYGKQAITEQDIEAVVQVLKGDWLTTGPAVDAFEQKLREKTGAGNALACANGTAALHLAYLSLGIGPDDLVIVPSMSFVATANAVLLCGADVIFADVDPDNGLLGRGNVESLLASLPKEKIPRIKAIAPVNLAGQPADLENIYALAREKGWKVVIDSCHALGTRYGGQGGADHAAGDCSFADMEVFSFHPVKTIATGEGGAVTTQHTEYYEKMTVLRGHGIVRDPAGWVANNDQPPPPWYYEMQQLGLNYRLSDLQCALGLSQLDRLDDFLAHRRVLVEKYDSLLGAGINGLVPFKKVANCQPGWHLYPVLVDFDGLGVSRTEVMTQLRARKVGTQVHYIPIHRQPYYVSRYGSVELPGADQYYRRTLSLPLHVNMSLQDVEYIVQAVQEVL